MLFKKLAETIGWLAIVFSILGMFNIGIFRFSYQWDGVGTINWQTNSFSFDQKISKFLIKIRD
jgi:hypothetical protein